MVCASALPTLSLMACMQAGAVRLHRSAGRLAACRPGGGGWAAAATGGRGGPPGRSRPVSTGRGLPESSHDCPADHPRPVRLCGQHWSRSGIDFDVPGDDTGKLPVSHHFTHTQTAQHGICRGAVPTRPGVAWTSSATCPAPVCLVQSPAAHGEAMLWRSHIHALDCIAAQQALAGDDEQAVARAKALALRPCAFLGCTCLSCASDAELQRTSKYCRGCRCLRYCSEQCQRSDWRKAGTGACVPCWRRPAGSRGNGFF